jgi:hypothetical protein
MGCLKSLKEDQPLHMEKSPCFYRRGKIEYGSSGKNARIVDPVRRSDESSDRCVRAMVIGDFVLAGVFSRIQDDDKHVRPFPRRFSCFANGFSHPKG